MTLEAISPESESCVWYLVRRYSHLPSVAEWLGLLEGESDFPFYLGRTGSFAPANQMRISDRNRGGYMITDK